MTIRRGRSSLNLALLALVVTLGAAGVARAAEIDTVTVADTDVFPESITNTKNGDLIIAGNTKGAVYRAKAGAPAASLWLDPAKTGMRSMLGVFADDASNTLYACSLAPRAEPRDLSLAALRSFDLKTGAAKATYQLPDAATALCNDIEVVDGAVYVTDTLNGSILKLAKGATALETWVKDAKLATVDGIARGPKGVLYVNGVRTNKLFSIAIGADGKAGAITELTPSLPLTAPDGMRALGGNKFLLAENDVSTGRVSVVTVVGDKAEISVIRQGGGVTGITRVGKKVWIANARFIYRAGGALAGQKPGPFTIESVTFP